MNHYERLEISRNASPEVIRAAYKSLMQHYHPDRNPGDTKVAEQATLIRQAYEVLSDPASRTAYDLELQKLAYNPEGSGKKVAPALLRTTPPARDDSSSFYLRLMFILALFIFAIFAWKAFKLAPAIDPQLLLANVASPGSETERAQPGADTRRAVEASQETPDATPATSSKTNRDQAHRNLPGYIKDMKVSLHELPGNPVKSSVHNLFIPRITVVVGDFDTDGYIGYINSNADIIQRKLAEMLKDARYDELASPDRKTNYLKEFILDAMGEITSTDRFKEYPSDDPLKPAHYGTVDILFPEGYTVD